MLKPLVFFVLHPSRWVLGSGDDALEGVVMDYSARWVRLAVPANVAAFVVGGTFRLDLYANTTAHERWAFLHHF